MQYAEPLDATILVLGAVALAGILGSWVWHEVYTSYRKWIESKPDWTAEGHSDGGCR